MKTIDYAVESQGVAQVVNPDKYYGIVPPVLIERRGFISRERYMGGKYNTLCRYGLTNHNHWDGFENDSLAGLINQLRRGNCTVYEFDTPQELFAWLAEKS